MNANMHFVESARPNAHHRIYAAATHKGGIVRLGVVLALIGLSALQIGCSKNGKRDVNIDSSGGTGSAANENLMPAPFEPLAVEYRELIQPPSKEGMNAAQREFWAYLDQYNRLPDNASEETVAIYNAKGIAPTFKYLSPALDSVLGNIEGLKRHREAFPARYPWVKSLMEEYKLEMPISEERFAGSAKAIGDKYNTLLKRFSGYNQKEYTEKEFVTCVLEGLLAVDYVYAKGTKNDRDTADEIWRGVFRFNYMPHPYEKALAGKLIVPATRDIGWATIAAQPEKMWGQTVGMLTNGFRLYAPVERMQLAKWLLLTDRIPAITGTTENNVLWGLMHNWRMEAGLKEYSIYVAHCAESARPADKPWGDVIMNVFRILYDKNFQTEYSKYQRLLNAAYPSKP